MSNFLNDIESKIELKKRIRKAYKQLRKEGLICKGNFLCCSNCAGYQLASEISDKIEKDKKYKDKIKGVVFWHKQAERSLMNNCTGLYLDFGNVNTSKFGVVGLSDTEIGYILKDALEKCNLEVEWNCNPRTKILVKNLT